IGSGSRGSQQPTETCLAGADHSGDRRGCGTAEIMRRAGVSKPCCMARARAACAKAWLACCARRPESPRRCHRRWWSRWSLTLTEPTGGGGRWTGRAMAAATGVSLRSVQRIWAAHGLQPHRVRRFKLSRDPVVAAKLRDVVGLYLDPPAHSLVLSVDEKSQIQALDRTKPRRPMKRVRPGTSTHPSLTHRTP